MKCFVQLASFFMLAGIACIANGQVINSAALYPSINNPRTQSNLSNMLTFADRRGRLVFESSGDSTTQRDGSGHEAGVAAGIFSRVGCAGVLLPVNHTSLWNDNHGYLAARRRDNNSTLFGVVLPQNLSTPGYPVSEFAMGYDIPLLGVLPYSTTVTDGGDGLTNSQTSIITASAANLGTSGYVLIDTEIISFSGVSSNTLTGCVRGILGTQAVTHAENATVKSVTIWSGPQVGYLGSSTLNGAIDNTVTTITVASTAMLPTSGRVKIDNEIIQYTGVTATTLTGCTRGNLSTTAASHSNGAVVQFSSNSGVGINYMIFPWHPLGNGGTYKAGVFWTSLSTSSVGGATFVPWLGTQANPSNLDSTYTTRFTGSATNFTGITAGSVTHSVLTATSIPYGNTTFFGGAIGNANGNGPFGPAAVMWNGLFAAARPTGAIQAMGISQGGRTLSSMLYELRQYHAGTGVVPFDTGLVQKYKSYIQTSAADLGGNGNAGLAHFSFWGHNETGGAGFGGMVDPAEPWTIAVQTTLNETLNSSDTTITLTSTAGLKTTDGHVLIDNERIYYAAISGNDITGCIRGTFGTAPASHTNGVATYHGYLQRHPLGFASDIFFEYKMYRSAWIAAGGDANKFWYTWSTPIPCSATKTFASYSANISTLAEKQARFKEFYNTVNLYCGSRQGFSAIDQENIWPNAESVSKEYGSSTSDYIHNTASAYLYTWQRALSSIPIQNN